LLKKKLFVGYSRRKGRRRFFLDRYLQKFSNPLLKFNRKVFLKLITNNFFILDYNYCDCEYININLNYKKNCVKDVDYRYIKKTTKKKLSSLLYVIRKKINTNITPINTVFFKNNNVYKLKFL
jgi:predicted nucleic acid-binding Zn finger protein